MPAPTPAPTRPATLALPELLSPPWASLWLIVQWLTVTVSDPQGAPPYDVLIAPPRAVPTWTTGPLPVLPLPPWASLWSKVQFETLPTSPIWRLTAPPSASPAS